MKAPASEPKMNFHVKFPSMMPESPLDANLRQVMRARWTTSDEPTISSPGTPGYLVEGASVTSLSIRHHGWPSEQPRTYFAPVYFGRYLVRLHITLTQPGHDDRVWMVTWKPQDPTCLASGSGDKTVRIWQRKATGDWQCSHILEGAHTRTIRSVAFSPTDSFIASAGFDSATAIWEKEFNNRMFNQLFIGVFRVWLSL